MYFVMQGGDSFLSTAPVLSSLGLKEEVGSREWEEPGFLPPLGERRAALLSVSCQDFGS